tara:strand:- start:343 stop:456 length:114 start_codon:yes stop_codon:yes gene_type:complete
MKNKEVMMVKNGKKTQKMVKNGEFTVKRVLKKSSKGG